MATVDLTTKFLPKVDEQFTAESKRSLVTNQDFTWDGAATVRVYKVSTGKICVSLNPAKAAPTNAHSDHVADSVQRITALERKLQDEQQRGQNIATEIINALYDQRQLTLNQIRVLCCQYIDGLTVPKTADKIGLSSDTVKNYRIKALAAFVVPEPVEVCEHEA